MKKSIIFFSILILLGSCNDNNQIKPDYSDQSGNATANEIESELSDLIGDLNNYSMMEISSELNNWILSKVTSSQNDINIGDRYCSISGIMQQDNNGLTQNNLLFSKWAFGALGTEISVCEVLVDTVNYFSLAEEINSNISFPLTITTENIDRIFVRSDCYEIVEIGLEKDLEYVNMQSIGGKILLENNFSCSRTFENKTDYISLPEPRLVLIADANLSVENVFSGNMEIRCAADDYYEPETPNCP